MSEAAVESAIQRGARRVGVPDWPLTPLPEAGARAAGCWLLGLPQQSFNLDRELSEAPLSATRR